MYDSSYRKPRPYNREPDPYSTFKKFAESLKASMVSMFNGTCTVRKYTVAHFYITGFLERNGAFIYFKFTPNQRPNEKTRRITGTFTLSPAKNLSDIYHRSNKYTDLEHLHRDVMELFQQLL